MIVNKTAKHYKQIDAFRDRSRFKFLLAGRRGGKTFGFKEDILSLVPQMPDKYGIPYIGPTNQDAMDLIWTELIDRLDELKWRYRPLISKQRIEFSRGRYIQVLGAEKIRRVRGKRFYRAYLDEIAFFTTPLNEVWRAIRPTLSDIGGGAVLGTTPNGKGTQAYDFYLETLKKPDWKFFHWTTLDNPFIDPNEVEAAKRELDPKSFNQEYLAGWESYEGLAYYCFDEIQHVATDGRCKPFDYAYPVELSFDFNVNPTTLLVSQNIPRAGIPHLYFRKEYSQKNSSTPDTVRSFCEDFKKDREHISLELYGDASGNSRKSTTGRSDYFYAEEMLKEYGFRFTKKVPGANPPIIDRVSYVNSWLKNVKGESRVSIDPTCTDLIRDLSSQVLEGRFPSDKNNLGHKADACGYRVYWQQIIASRGDQKTVEL
jgi:hypothetical protein